MLLMILRSAGLVTIVLFLILSFLGSGSDIAKLARLGWLVAGVAALWLVSSSKALDWYLSRVVSRALQRWTSLDVRDYASLLRLSGEYRVIEVQVREGDWVAGKNLQCCYLPEEGITVLGISRADGSYVGGPRGETQVYAGDTLILYGRAQKLQELDERRADVTGDEAHDEAVGEQRQHIKEQERREREYKAKREAEVKQQAS